MLYVTLLRLACCYNACLFFNSEVALYKIFIIINDVRDANKSELSYVILCPPTTEEFTAIAKQFETIPKFLYSCSAMDGKHVVVTCLWNTGCVYRN